MRTGIGGVIGRLARLLEVNHGTWRGWVRHGLAQLSYLFGRCGERTELPAAPLRRLVFVCLGNINRSAFGAEVARGIGLPAISIGLATTTGAEATAMAQAQAAEQGFGLQAHRATDLSDYRFEPGDLLIAMEWRHVECLVAHGLPEQSIVMLGAWATPQRLHLHDPHTLSAAYFSTCFTLIESAVRHLGRVLAAAPNWQPPRT